MILDDVTSQATQRPCSLRKLNWEEYSTHSKIEAEIEPCGLRLTPWASDIVIDIALEKAHIAS